MTSAKTKPRRRGRKDKQRTLVMLAMVLINGLFQISTNDRIPVGYGFGYDGQLYAALARNFPQEVRNRQALSLTASCS